MAGPGAVESRGSHVELLSTACEAGLQTRTRDKRMRPIPKKLKGKTMPDSGAFRVMAVGNRSGAPAALRRLAAKRTSESTMMAAKLASATRPTAMLPNRKALLLLPPQTSSHASGKRLTVTEVKEEQVRLLALLRSLNPSQVVDQICRALTFFGGIPGAPAPSSKHVFPSSAAANGSGSLFVSWLSEIFPRLGPTLPELAHTGNSTTVSKSNHGSPGEIRIPETGLHQTLAKKPGEATQPPRDSQEAADGNKSDHVWADVVESSSKALGSTEETTVRSPQMVTSTVSVSDTGNSNPARLARVASSGAHIDMPPRRGRGRPKGSKNRPKGVPDVGDPPAVSRNEVSLTDVRRGRGRPKGSKNKMKERAAPLRERSSNDKGPQVSGTTAHALPVSIETRQRTATATSRMPQEGGRHAIGQQGSPEVALQPVYPPGEHNVQSFPATSVQPKARAGEIITRQLGIESPLLVQQDACASVGPIPAVEDEPPSRRMKASMGRERDRRQQMHNEHEESSSEFRTSTQPPRHQQGLLGGPSVATLGFYSAPALPSTGSYAKPRSYGSQPGNVANEDSVGPKHTLSTTPGIGGTVIDISGEDGSQSTNNNVRHISSVYPVGSGRSFEQANRGPLPQNGHCDLDGQHHNYMQPMHILPTALASTGFGRHDQHPALTRQQLNLPDSSSRVPRAREVQPRPLGRRETDTSAPMSHDGFGVFTSTGSTPQNLPTTNVNPRASYTTGSDISALHDYSHPNFVDFEPTAPSAHGRDVAGPAYPP